MKGVSDYTVRPLRYQLKLHLYTRGKIRSTTTRRNGEHVLPRDDAFPLHHGEEVLRLCKHFLRVIGNTAKRRRLRSNEQCKSYTGRASAHEADACRAAT